MYPGEVLDAQRDLLLRLDERPGFRRSLKALIHHHTGDQNFKRQIEAAKKQDGHSLPPEMWEEIDQASEGPMMALEMALKTGCAYRVTPDMCAMVEHLASELEGLERFNVKLAPTPTGIVRFERPLPVKDIRGKIMLINWLVWGPVMTVSAETGTHTTGTLLWHFNDRWTHPDDIDGMFEAQYREAQDEESWETYSTEIGRWATVGLDVAFPEQRLGMPEWEASTWQAQSVREEGFEPFPGTNAMRYVHAAWLLMDQTLPGVEEEKPDRPAFRRAKKMRLPGKVTVIRLRREKAETSWEGETNVEWSHRWVVRGHHRWQPYGVRVSDHEHVWSRLMVEAGQLVKACTVPGCDNYLAQIDIKPYTKGPVDKPFVQTEKVYSLER